MKPDIFDVLAILGAALIVFAAWQMYRPAAYMVVGLLLLYVGITGAKRQ